ncbi:MAG: hypothetical protein Q9217_006322 [Psora testacea]
MANQRRIDLELGQQEIPLWVTCEGIYLLTAACLRRLLAGLSWVFSQISTSVSEDWKSQMKQIEDYPSGYPRFSALIAAHNSFHLTRRFSTLRARLLLAKQDRLSLLEEQLETLDQNENTPLRLGSCRSDDNNERNTVLSEIDSALADYDALLERNSRIFSLERAKLRNILSLQHWIDGNACLARRETAYLGHYEDLVAVAPSGDRFVASLEAWVEAALVRFYRWFPKVSDIRRTFEMTI